MIYIPVLQTRIEPVARTRNRGACAQTWGHCICWGIASPRGADARGAPQHMVLHWRVGRYSQHCCWNTGRGPVNKGGLMVDLMQITPPPYI